MRMGGPGINLSNLGLAMRKASSNKDLALLVSFLYITSPRYQTDLVIFDFLEKCGMKAWSTTARSYLYHLSRSI